MSLCDRCKAPGACCRSMVLFGHGLDEPDLSDADAIAILDGINERTAGFRAEGDMDEWPLPMVPYSRDWRGSILWTCPKLGDDGRCTIYETRPAVCRRFEPGSSPLCVHHEDGADKKP